MSQATSDAYIYQPLNPLRRQIRLLRLAPGIFGQPVRGSLIIISLGKLRRRRWQQLREWHALSYVWGAPDRNEFIRVTRKKIHITKTLFRALQYLRCQRDEKYLWIDQICINQDDIKERSSQVQLMKEVYSSATSVLAWLGEDKPDNDGLLCMISQMADIIRLSNAMLTSGVDSIQELEELQCKMPPEELTRWTSGMDLASVIKGMKAEVEELKCNISLEEGIERWLFMDLADAVQELRTPKWALKLDKLVFQAMRLKASDEIPREVIATLRERFAEIFRNAWFSRVWTLQEAVFAKHLVLLSGWSRATFEEFTSAFWRFSMSCEPDDFFYDPGQYELSSIMSLRSWHKQNHERSPPQNSAEERRSGISRTITRSGVDRKASNPRDYVYGQFVLFNPKVGDTLNPDYSLRIEEVFIAGTVALLESDENLNVLGPCCAVRKDGSYPLPSWCPDWSDTNFGCEMRHVDPKDDVFTAATEHRTHIKYESLGSALFIRGLVIDEIHKSISGIQIQGMLAPRKLYLFDIWESVLTAISSPNEPPITYYLAQTLCRTFLSDIFENRRLDEANISEALTYFQDYDIGVDENVSVDYAKDFMSTMGYKSIRVYLRRNVDLFLADRSIFKTKNRRFGQSCHHVRPGDKVCLLYGGRLPFILRGAGMTKVVNENGETFQKQCYQMIGGECYVHGLVDGEGLEIARRENLPVEDFCLI